MKRVLVIECDESTSETLDEIIKFEHCIVEIANCAAIAKNLLESKRYDIVFADHWTIRNENAYDLLSKLNDQDTIIFILSSFKDCVKDFRAVKYKSILSKPFAIDELLRCLATEH